MFGFNKWKEEKKAEIELYYAVDTLNNITTTLYATSLDRNCLEYSCFGITKQSISYDDIFNDELDFAYVSKLIVKSSDIKETYQEVMRKIKALNDFANKAESINYEIEKNELVGYELTKLDGTKFIADMAKFAEGYEVYLGSNIIKWTDGTSELFQKITPMYNNTIETTHYIWYGSYTGLHIQQDLKRIKDNLTPYEGYYK